MPLTTEAQLDEVQAAITAVLAGQEYTIGDITYELASLEALQTREDKLLSRFNRENRNSGMRTRANFSGGID